jgi:cytochrome c oxidase assembly protein Cox11
MVFIGVMLLLVSYSPTIYREFCVATGFGGTTRRADTDSYAASDRVVTVRLDSNVAPDLPWRFDPQEREVKVHLGEQRLVFFTAENTSDQAIVEANGSERHHGRKRLLREVGTRSTLLPSW